MSWLLLLASYQTAQPKFSMKSKTALTIENFNFEQSLATDAGGSGWKLVEIKPAKLPYTGKIARLTAQERWMKLFRSALESIKTDCNGAPKQMPEIKAAELDYTKFGSSPEHPAYIQAKYMCR